MRGDHSGRIDIDQNPCNPTVNIHLAPGQQSPGISIFDALGNLVQSFPVTIPPPVSLSSAVILAPNTLTRNKILPTADVPGIVIGQFAGGVNPLFSIVSNTNLPILTVGPVDLINDPTAVTIQNNDPNAEALIVTGPSGGTGTQIAQFDDGSIGVGANLGCVFSIGFDARIGGSKNDSSGSNLPLWGMIPSWAPNTHGSARGKVSFQVYGNASGFTTEAFQILAGTSAGQAGIGFLGANAIVRPSATTDLLQDLINYGLKTSGGPTPLNLLGGAFQASTISDVVTDAATSITTQMILLRHASTLTPVAGFGSHIEFALDDSANINKRGGKVSCEWVTPTDGSTVSSVTLHAAKVNSFVPCLVADGNQQVTIPGNFFHNGIVGTNQIGFFQVGPVGQQANASQTAITAVLDANAKSALQAIYNLLKNYGLAPATA